jgi:hypothetical protein
LKNKGKGEGRWEAEAAAEAGRWAAEEAGRTKMQLKILNFGLSLLEEK